MIAVKEKKTVLWWGRSDVDYSRNRILRAIMRGWGWDIVDFFPVLSALGDVQAWFQTMPQPDLVWVPCFRQRDFFAASRYARKIGVPLVFDPLISSYDKAVFEKNKLKKGSKKAEKLRLREGKMFQRADRVLADTAAHARFFVQELGARPENTSVVIVGAEEGLFVPQAYEQPNTPIEVLFYGSFIPLQGVDVIVQAAARVPEVNWTLLGGGKLYESAVEQAKHLSNVRFESWVPYEQLARRIGEADILLGVFGVTPKAARVIPNKVYQSLACARPVITMASSAYSEAVTTQGADAIKWVAAGEPEALADAVRSFVAEPHALKGRGASARKVYENFYSSKAIEGQLAEALGHLL